MSCRIQRVCKICKPKPFKPLNESYDYDGIGFQIIFLLRFLLLLSFSPSVKEFSNIKMRKKADE